MLLEGTDDADPVVGMKTRGGGRIGRGEPSVEGEASALPGQGLERASERGIGGGGRLAPPPQSAGGEGGGAPHPREHLPPRGGPPPPPGLGGGEPRGMSVVRAAEDDASEA